MTRSPFSPTARTNNLIGGVSLDLPVFDRWYTRIPAVVVLLPDLLSFTGESFKVCPGDEARVEGSEPELVVLAESEFSVSLILVGIDARILLNLSSKVSSLWALGISVVGATG